MDVAFNPFMGQISSIRAARFAAPEEKTAKTAEQSQDQMNISREGRQAMSESEGKPGFEQFCETLETTLRSMTKDDFVSTVQEQLGEQELEVNWNAAVDPDGQLWCKAYFDAYVSQAIQFRGTAESAIRDYYNSAYQEALNSPLGQNLSNQLNFIAAKYQCSWSDYFAASIPTNERQWTYTQVRAMLTGTGLKLNDPFALKDIHIPTAEEATKIARQAADDRISELVRQAKEASGISG